MGFHGQITILSFLLFLLADDADKLIGRRTEDVEGAWGSCSKKLIHAQESCGDWTGATGDGCRAEVAFFSSEDFL